MKLGNTFSTLLACCICLSAGISQINTFSNTTVAACNSWDSGNLYTGFTRNITVSGLPTPLGTGSGQVVLRQVNVKLGNPGCLGNLSTYNIRLLSPTGTIIQLCQPFTTTSTSQWFDIKYRDHSALERIIDYSATTKQNYWPWSIGYYRTHNINAYSTVNGENPNGTWVLQIQENTSSEVTFEKVELVFGPPITVTDITASTSNDICTAAQCIDTKSVVAGTNGAGYASTDPNYPGNTVSGCGWNGANNNSAWFQFIANSTTAYITVSGLANNPTSTSTDTQPIVVQRSGGCTSGTWSVPTGGCPDDISINNFDYLTPNGGTGTAANVYVDGISANAEFNLSGLTVGQTYFLYIDGNGGTPSTFYIEMPNGSQDCAPLPIELISFDVDPLPGKKGLATWVTSSEINNEYFEIEKSLDAVHYTTIGRIEGSGNSNTVQHYSLIDDGPILNTTYYKLKQVDYNGQFQYFGPRVLTPKNIIDPTLYPNPTNDISYLEFANENDDILNITIIDVSGRVVKTFTNSIVSGHNTIIIDLTMLSNGTYFLTAQSGHLNLTTKIMKQ